MKARPYAAALVALALLLVSGCSDDEPAALPVTPSAAASAPTSTPEPTPTPTPSPSPTPLSPFESDPAVVALRAYLAVSSEAINTENLDLPSFTALATAARASRHKQLYTEDLGDYYPGPPPTAVRGVQVASPSKRVVAICLQDGGFALDKQGGKPTVPVNVEPALAELVLEGSQWKVDTIYRDENGSCAGVAIPGGTS